MSTHTESHIDSRSIHDERRAEPGSKGTGEFYHIEVRPSSEFKIFRTQDVGDKGHLERRAGQRSNGSWDTVAWLISKEDAHVRAGKLIIDNKEIKESISIRGPIIHKKGDIFKAHPRRDIPERNKPTEAQKNARRKNIKKAQAARWKARSE